MIRFANINDRSDIYRLICLLENTELNQERFDVILNTELNSDDFLILVYEEEDGICGVMEMRMTDQLHHAGRIAEIMSLYVESDRRSKSIGKQLFQEAVRYAEKAGCIQMELNSSTWRTDAHRFYEREGMNKDHFNFTMKLNGNR